MFFVCEVRILHERLLSVQLINMFRERKLYSRVVLRPVVTIGYEEHGSWRGQAGDLDIAEDLVPCPVDGHPAFTGAAAEKMGRDHHNGNRDFDPVVQGRGQKCLCSTTRLSGNAYPVAS